jgi:hypothetical protein
MSKPSLVSGLNDILPQLKKGAPVAYNPSAYERLDLKVDGRQALCMEVQKKWKHLFAIYDDRYLLDRRSSPGLGPNWVQRCQSRIP